MHIKGSHKMLIAADDDAHATLDTNTADAATTASMASSTTSTASLESSVVADAPSKAADATTTLASYGGPRCRRLVDSGIDETVVVTADGGENGLAPITPATTVESSASPMASSPPGAEPVMRIYAPKQVRKYRLNEEKKKKLALLIDKHTQQLAAPTTPIGSGRDSCQDMSHEHATSCHFEELAVLGPNGKLLAIDNCILDNGAFRGIISLSELQRLVNI